MHALQHVLCRLPARNNSKPLSQTLGFSNKPSCSNISSVCTRIQRHNNLWHGHPLKICSIWHRNISSSNPLHWCIKILEAFLHNRHATQEIMVSDVCVHRVDEEWKRARVLTIFQHLRHVEENLLQQ